MFKIILSLLLILANPLLAHALSFNDGVEKKIIFFGDSITEGTGSTTGFAYRGQTQATIGSGDYMAVGPYNNPATSTTYYAFHAGIGGDNVEDVNTRIDAALDSYLALPNNDSSVVVLYAGINDMNASEDAQTNVDVIADSPLTSTSILGKIHAHDPNVKVFIGLIQPSTSGALDARIVTFNTLLESRIVALQATKSNLHYFDIYAAMSNTANCSTVSACMTDTLHPNDTGYTVMGTTIGNCIVSTSSTYCDNH